MPGDAQEADGDTAGTAGTNRRPVRTQQPPNLKDASMSQPGHRRPAESRLTSKSEISALRRRTGNGIAIGVGDTRWAAGGSAGHVWHSRYLVLLLF